MSIHVYGSGIYQTSSTYLPPRSLVVPPRDSYLASPTGSGDAMSFILQPPINIGDPSFGANVGETQYRRGQQRHWCTSLDAGILWMNKVRRPGQDVARAGVQGLFCTFCICL